MDILCNIELGKPMDTIMNEVQQPVQQPTPPKPKRQRRMPRRGTFSNDIKPAVAGPKEEGLNAEDLKIILPFIHRVRNPTYDKDDGKPKYNPYTGRFEEYGADSKYLARIRPDPPRLLDLTKAADLDRLKRTCAHCLNPPRYDNNCIACSNTDTHGGDLWFHWKCAHVSPHAAVPKEWYCSSCERNDIRDKRAK
jgi:hypothetical protein